MLTCEHIPKKIPTYALLEITFNILKIFHDIFRLRFFICILMDWYWYNIDDYFFKRSYKRYIFNCKPLFNLLCIRSYNLEYNFKSILLIKCKWWKFIMVDPIWRTIFSIYNPIHKTFGIWVFLRSLITKHSTFKKSKMAVGINCCCWIDSYRIPVLGVLKDNWSFSRCLFGNIYL